MTQNLGRASAQRGVFYPENLIKKLEANVQKCTWANKIQQSIIDRAEPWLEFSDNEL